MAHNIGLVQLMRPRCGFKVQYILNSTVGNDAHTRYVSCKSGLTSRTHQTLARVAPPKPPVQDLKTRILSGVDQHGKPTYVMTPKDTQFLKLKDGRVLCYGVYGKQSPSAKVVVAWHGNPGSRIDYLAFHDWGKSNNVRIIAIDRPGVGRSTYIDCRNHNVLDHARDLEQLVDHLGVKRFHVVGVSGGCPAALACAYYFPNRVEQTGIMSGLMPLEATHVGRHWHAVMFTMACQLLPSLATRYYQRSVDKEKDWIYSRLAHGMLTPEHSDFYEFVERNRQGARGYIEDYRRNCNHWGFDFRDIRVKVIMYHGNRDIHTSISSARWCQKRNPDYMRLREFIGLNHHTVQNHWVSLLNEVLSRHKKK